MYPRDGDCGERRKGVRYLDPIRGAWAIFVNPDVPLRVFPVRSHERRFNRAKNSGRPCLLGIPISAAPCVGKISLEENMSWRAG